jgi:hypothetical protein
MKKLYYIINGAGLYWNFIHSRFQKNKVLMCRQWSLAELKVAVKMDKTSRQRIENEI